jgi:hypothetical protein
MRPSSLLIVAVTALIAAGVIVKSLPPDRTDGAPQARRTTLDTKSVYGTGVALPDNRSTVAKSLLSLP